MKNWIYAALAALFATGCAPHGGYTLTGEVPEAWEGKPVALIATCGYPVEKGADLWEAGMQRYCKHSRLRLLGMLAQRHRGYDTVFMDPEKARLAAEFARKVNESV